MLYLLVSFHPYELVGAIAIAILYKTKLKLRELKLAGWVGDPGLEHRDRNLEPHYLVQQPPAT